MKKTTLSRLHDGANFKLSIKSKVTYSINRKEKGGVLFSSNNSGLTFKRIGKTICYV